MKKTVSLFISIITLLVMTLSHSNATAQTTANWEQLAPPDQPEARLYQSMAYDSDRHVAVMTGGENYTAQFSDTYEYSSGKWVKKDPAHVPPVLGTLAYDSKNKNTVLYSLGETWTWDGNDWTKKDPLHNPSSPLVSSKMTFDSNRGVVVLITSSKYTWEWDGVDWTDKTPSLGQPAPDPYDSGASAMAYDSSRGVVVLYGGNLTRTNNIWEWNGSVWKQVPTVNSPDPMYYANMIYDANRQRLVLFGGRSFDLSGGSTVYNDIWEYDDATKTWIKQLTTNPPEKRERSGMAYDTDRGMVIIFGGFDFENREENLLGDTWEWDGNLGTWTKTLDLQNPLFMTGARFSYDPVNGQGLMVGGGVNPNDMYTYSSKVWLWVSKEGKWKEILYNDSMIHPSGRVEPSNAYFGATGETIIFGGRDPYNYPPLDDTWSWNGKYQTWQKLNPQNSPSPRAEASMAYDSRRHVLVLYGGVGSTVKNDTWEWDGNDWHQVQTQHFPDAGVWQWPMAYDPIRGVMVLVTWDMNGIENTWEFDGNDWKLIQTPTPVTGAYYGSMVFDDARNVIVLVGNGFAPRWEYDGNDWVQTGSYSDPGLSMIYDTVRKSLITFTGYSTWEFKETSNYDPIPPTTTLTLNPADPNGLNGWYKSPVHITVNSIDNPGGSGVAEIRCVIDPVTAPLSFDEILSNCAYTGTGADYSTERQHTIYAASKDNAGNKSLVVSKSFKLDITPPNLSPVITPNPIILKGTATINPNASDNVSGIASQSCGPLDTSTVGTKTVICSATDIAGNVGSKSVTYKVIYRFDGFLQPINDNGHQTCPGCPTSIFKGNSTVIVKFQLKDANGNLVHSSSPPIWITPVQGGTTSDPVDESVYSDPETTGNSFALEGDHYAYNWKTKGFATGYYWRIGVQLDDGQIYYVYIGLR